MARFIRLTHMLCWSLYVLIKNNEWLSFGKPEMPETTGNNSDAYKLLNDTNRRICYDGSVCAMCRDCFSEEI